MDPSHCPGSWCPHCRPAMGGRALPGAAPAYGLFQAGHRQGTLSPLQPGPPSIQLWDGFAWGPAAGSHSVSPRLASLFGPLSILGGLCSSNPGHPNWWAAGWARLFSTRVLASHLSSGTEIRGFRPATSPQALGKWFCLLSLHCRLHMPSHLNPREPYEMDSFIKSVSQEWDFLAEVTSHRHGK